MRNTWHWWLALCFTATAGWVVWQLQCVTPMAVEAAADDDFSAEEDKPKGKDPYATELKTPLIGDYTNFAGLEPTPLEGVGLVTGLQGTGGDPAPSQYRTALLEDMKRRGVRNPNALLQSPNTALVLVRAYLPPLLKKGETLDVEIVAPDGAEVSSLVGGWLMETYLTEQAFVPGRGLLKGHPYARAQGPLLVAGVGAAPSASKDDSLLRRGRVLGGAFVIKERELAIHLRNEFRSVRNSQRVAEAIGRRFHHFNEHGSKKPMAEAKTDQRIMLDVHPRYKDNYPRYLQVVRNIAFRETPVAQRVRMQKLHDELMNPETSDRAALQLEAIGKESAPILKLALKSPLLEVRFHAASALAYLEDASGLPALVEAARTERAFRVFALAAMSTLDDPQAHLELRELMNEPSAETRYGAFRALWTLDKNDPFIRGAMMGLKRGADDDVQETNIKSTWMMHVLQAKGEPMVHCTLRTRPEVVLFGAEQKLVPPLVLSAGRQVLITAQPGSETVSVVRFDSNKEDQRREVSLKLADVLQAADALGVTYPDVVQMLTQASEQRNLESRLENDALPKSGRIYARPAMESKPGSKAKIGREHLSPNIFPREEEDAQFKSNDGMQAKAVGSAPDGMASVNEGSASSKERAASDADGRKAPKDAKGGGAGKKDDDAKNRGFWDFWSRSKKSN